VGRLLDEVRATIDRHGLLLRGEKVVVGVSGGPDSLCLLHLLCRLRGEYDLGLHVAHLHHGLRGPDADADAAFVAELAAGWCLQHTVEEADVAEVANQHGLAVEEAARRARYAFLGRVAAAIGAQAIAVGHNADDQAETVLMHWLRGSGTAGLRGMLPLTRFSDYRLLDPADVVPGLAGLKLIRPLLATPRAVIEAYCVEQYLEPRFDRSNLDTTYFRNWLRHEVLPLLARHNPNVQDVIRRSAQVLSDDHDLLRSMLEDTWPRVTLHESDEQVVFNLSAWRSLPTSLQRSTLREAIHRLRRSLRNINFIHVENALVVARDGTTGKQATLPGNLALTMGYDRFIVADAGIAAPLPDWPLLARDSDPLPAEHPGDTELPDSDWTLSVMPVPRADLPPKWRANADPFRAFLDANAVGRRMWLRTRRPGDRFQPLGMGGSTVKLADFLTNEKVPRTIRDRLPLLVSEAGLVWVCGLRVDERAKVSERTEDVLVVRFHPRVH
jgi:tRNA(Ile)-lysidine synthase